MRSNHLGLVAYGLGVGVTAGAWGMSSGDLPPEHTKGAVTYMSGGIGAERSAEMRREASKFPLDLEFISYKNAPDALYLANVEVTIRNAAGKILLDARSDGPYLLATLPDGRYTVSAEHAGRSETRNVSVERGQHPMVVFNWAS